MSNQLTIRERPNKKNVESLDLTGKVNLLGLWRGNYAISDCNIENLSYLNHQCDDMMSLMPMWPIFLKR